MTKRCPNAAVPRNPSSSIILTPISTLLSGNPRVLQSPKYPPQVAPLSTVDASSIAFFVYKYQKQIQALTCAPQSLHHRQLSSQLISLPQHSLTFHNPSPRRSTRLVLKNRMTIPHQLQPLTNLSIIIIINNIKNLHHLSFLP